MTSYYSSPKTTYTEFSLYIYTSCTIIYTRGLRSEIQPTAKNQFPTELCYRQTNNESPTGSHKSRRRTTSIRVGVQGLQPRWHNTFTTAHSCRPISAETLSPKKAKISLCLASDTHLPLQLLLAITEFFGRNIQTQKKANKIKRRVY